MDKIFCKGCNKTIDIAFDTYVAQCGRWDVFCAHCDTWLGGMLKLMGWEINE